MRAHRKRMVLSTKDLSPRAIAFLRNGWQVDEAEADHFWCSKEAILCEILDSSEDEDAQMLTDIPNSWWVDSNIGPDMRKEMENLWAEDPSNEVEWK